ncbi:MAG: hypothetical protein ACREVF_02520 [Burkholderiales bacterium]
MISGIALIAVLWLPPLRGALEAGMTTHMLVQIPLLACAGLLIAGAFEPHLAHIQDHTDRSGIATALIAVFASSFWMLPRALDAALADPWMETAKFLSLPLLVGVPARLCAPRLPAIAVGFILANLLSMWAVAGWLYRAFPAQLCNFYLIDQQVVAGGVLLAVSGLLAVLWLASFFFGGYAAAHAPSEPAAVA